MHSGPELLGENVRRLRRTRGLSLVELGRFAGLAKGTLTQIEAGRGNPTIETLQALARALGASLTDLVAETDDDRPQVVRSTEGEPLVRPGIAGRLVHRTHAGSAIIELYEWRLAAGAVHRGVQHPPGVTEHVFVLDGEAEVGPEDTTVVLGPRDSVRYAADVPHLYRAVQGRALVLVQMVYPALPSGTPPQLLATHPVDAIAPVPDTMPAAPPTPVPPGPVPVPGVRPALPQPPVRGRRPTTRTLPGPAARPKPPGPGR
ncbi:helix-turn-helix domain-containing protein [Patulibacter americanus]|uniref:helix-turn-helix domain-containing protein n=1 Tax=Patulibacter americanus TaxID=588672 RepID=UPI0003B60A3C|nr:XRE family transcriptional regulator [Patulibacter americanus]